MLSSVTAPSLRFVVVLQGDERIRRSVLTEGGKLLTHYYSDAQTMYEVFLRGIRESSQSRSACLCAATNQKVFLAFLSTGSLHILSLLC